MFDGSPLRACLVDFAVPPSNCALHDIGWLRSRTIVIKQMLMSPELLASKFSFTELIPTPEAEVYAF